MGKILKKIFATVLIAISFSFICLTPASLAAENGAIKILPKKISIEVKPGTKTDGKFSISNNSDKPKTVVLSKKNFRTNKKSNRTKFFAGPGGGADFIYPLDKELVLKPKAETEIKFRIQIPEDKASGGYNGALILTDKEKGSSGYAVLFLINVLPGLDTPIIGNPELALETQKMNTSYPVPLLLSIHNNANLNVIASGTLVIRNWRNKEIDRTDTGPLIIYPESAKKVGWKWSNKDGFGIYKAEFSMALPGNKIVKEKKWFIAIPFKKILAKFSPKRPLAASVN